MNMKANTWMWEVYVTSLGCWDVRKLCPGYLLSTDPRAKQFLLESEAEAYCMQMQDEWDGLEEQE